MSLLHCRTSACVVTCVLLFCGSSLSFGGISNAHVHIRQAAVNSDNNIGFTLLFQL